MALPEINWPKRILGPPPGARDIKVVSTVYLAWVLVVLVTVLVTGGRFGGAAGPDFSKDFVGFYGVGRLLNTYPPESLYDFGVQEKVYLELRPTDAFLTLPYVHAPFEALLFQPLARLPYETAYLLWLICGMAAYSLALVMITRRFGPAPGPERQTVFLLAYSFSPFVMEAWVGGNVSVLAFVALAGAVTLEDARKPLLAGCALALCLNKPSLLVLILPMLLVSRRFKMLAGFCIGTGVLVMASALLLGIQVWEHFVRALLWWARSTTSQPGVFRDWKYVDLNAFSRVLPGGRSALALGVVLVCSGWVIAMLFLVWRRLPEAGREARYLAWATAMTWSLVINAYVPIYDCTLLVLAGVLAAAALRDRVTGVIPSTFAAVVTLCYVSALITQPIARLMRVQIYTLVLAYTGLWLLQQARRLQATAVARRPIVVSASLSAERF